MKKLSLFLFSVAILCLINVTNIRADGTVNQTNPANTEPAHSTTPNVEVSASQSEQTYLSLPAQFVQILSNILKTKQDEVKAIIRNTK